MTYFPTKQGEEFRFPGEAVNRNVTTAEPQESDRPGFVKMVSFECECGTHSEDGILYLAEDGKTFSFDPEYSTEELFEHAIAASLPDTPATQAAIAAEARLSRAIMRDPYQRYEDLRKQAEEAIAIAEQEAAQSGI